MNCQSIQNRILALPDPRQIPDALLQHVAGCAGCRAWAEQAARLEGLLERLPVPPAPAGKKGDLIADLARGPVAAPARGPFAAPFLTRNAALVGGLAAAVAVALGAWLLFSGNGNTPELARGTPTPKHPFLEKVVRHDVALAKADSPAKRLDVFGGLAGDISAEARGLARIANAEELRDVARWYDRVVKDGMMKQAETLARADLTVPPAERKSRLEALAGKLAATADETEKAARDVPENAKGTLQRIANTARDGEKKLRQLAQ
jgi:hypothetical protein